MHHDNHEPDQWHVEKSVPLALIWAIGVQTIVLIVGGTLAYAEVQAQARDLARIEHRLDRDVNRLDAQMSAITAASNQQAVQMGRIEESLSGMRADISRMIQIWERSTQ